MKPILIPLSALSLALSLGGCISFGAKPPPTLMTLASDATLPADTTRVAREGSSVTVYVPTAPPELGGLRVPVKAGATAIAYLAKAQWADAPTRLFRQLLADTITARTGRVALDPRQYALAPGMRLSGRLGDFGLDAATSKVVATFDAVLIRKDGATLETRRFQATAPVATQDGPAVAAALSVASNRIAGEIADWVGKV